MRALVIVLAGMAISIAAAACDAMGSDRSQSDAAAQSEGGAVAGAGAGANASGTGGHAPDFQVPSCVRELIDACGTDTACRVETDEDAGVAHYCYDSGARAESSPSACGSVSGRSELVVSKADGSPCFSFEISDVFQGQACEHGKLTWRDAHGATVATGWFGGGMGTNLSVSCSDRDESASCSNDACPDRWLLFGRDDCDPGRCAG